jgi:hypothetical protein
MVGDALQLNLKEKYDPGIAIIYMLSSCGVSGKWYQDYDAASIDTKVGMRMCTC